MCEAPETHPLLLPAKNLNNQGSHNQVGPVLGNSVKDISVVHRIFIDALESLWSRFIYQCPDAGSIPGWGPKIPHVVERLSPNATAREKTARRSKELGCGSQTNKCFLEKEFVGQGVTNSGTCLLAANKMQRKKIKLLSSIRLCDPMDYSPPGSSVHGIFQPAR